MMVRQVPSKHRHLPNFMVSQNRILYYQTIDIHFKFLPFPSSQVFRMHFKYEWTLCFRVYVNCKSKAAPVHAVKTYRGSRCIAPLILKLGTRCRWAVNFRSRPLYHLESAPIPTEQEPGWAPAPVWTFWWREKSLTAARIGIPDGSTRDLVTTMTTLSRLPTYCHTAPDLSYYIPHSATYIAPQLNNQPLNIWSTKQSSTIFLVSRFLTFHPIC